MQANVTNCKKDKMQKRQNANRKKKQMGRNTNKAPPKYKCTKIQIRQNAKRQLRQNTNKVPPKCKRDKMQM